MFLNMLVKYIPDEIELSSQFRNVLIFPKDEKIAAEQLESFIEFLEKQRKEYESLLERLTKQIEER